MKFNFALVISGLTFASALHVPISFSEEAGLQRQIVDTSRGWLSHYIYGESSESIDKATPLEVSENAWDVLKNDPKKFSKFTTILEKFSPSAVDHIKNEKDYTLFVPTNDAIPDHKEKDKGCASHDETDIPNYLGKLYAEARKSHTFDDEERKKHFSRFVEAVVMYHTVDQKLDVKTLHDFSTVETILTEPNTLNGAGQRLRIEQQFVPPATVINHFAKISTQDIKSSNAVIHALDHVLIPPPSAINALFIFAREFSIFTSALQKVGLAPLLDLSLDGKRGNGHLTINAPLNSAFEKLPPKVLGFLFSPLGTEHLKRLLEYHIVPENSIFIDFQSNKQAKSNENDDLFHKKVKAKTLLKDADPIEYELIKSQTVPYGPYSFDVKVQGKKSVSWHDGIARNAAVQVLDELLIPPKEKNQWASIYQL
ncbi:FAS1 domain-containing protein [Wallemia mellicola]|nr:FAS1 domain-containing protein [Wallemia mellicola]